MKTKLLICLGIFALLAVGTVSVVLAHGGGLNSDGCHNDRKRGTYHCHRAPRRTRTAIVVQRTATPTRARAPTPTRTPTQDQGWPTTCVALNDIVEAHLGNYGNVGIYQRTFSNPAQAEQACRIDHRNDVRSTFAWAFD